jgi:hypothetical protein
MKTKTGVLGLSIATLLVIMQCMAREKAEKCAVPGSGNRRP